MGRRWAGALLVLLTIVGVTVIASATGIRLAGSPIAVALPGPPSIGECMLADPAAGISAAGSSTSPRVPSFGPCGSAGVGRFVARAGEVVAVRTTTGTDRAIASNPADCRPSALAYAGLRPRGDAWTVPGAPADDPIRWSYSVDVETTWVTQVPSRPEASGWAACVARPAAAASGPGRLVDAFGGGALPGGYGTCWQSDDLSAGARMVDCDEPHVAELIALGRAVGDQPVDPERARQSCVGQASIVLRRADPTVDGTLAIRLHPARTQTGQSELSPACFITAADDRRIVGSLVGLGPAQVKFFR